jgi:hypothetical protein
LNNEVNSVDLTGVYATASPPIISGSYTNPLTITFSQPVSGFSIVVTNNLADTFKVADNLGGSATKFLSLNSLQTFTLSDAGITSVTIAAANTGLWDFAIDNVSFTPTAVATPEPATLTMLGIGVAGLTGYAWRRRKLQRPATA